MQAHKLTDQLSVSPQIALEDISKLSALGYKSVICNRPDKESDDQPAMLEIETAVKEAGLIWLHQPVISGNITDQNVEDFSKLIETLPKPIFAFCRTGTRCSILWALSQANKMSVDDILDTAAEAGYNLNGQQARLETLAQK
ncbi:MAG TPA: TIGR01244 family phosphatase [Oceanospirillales bacterium]|nr:TIGR01244 family phosphatase [Oleispira sp.]HCM06182.1 TIGR01244 family phosphatase [Oceanospirillales bacterium]|tara:strand:+ start:1329 stop:1754 length:426 start_codon:yes stop_codon:yes gene_type:complete